MKMLPPEKEMERGFYSSDADYDGIFFAAVRTTGIFCRPSCTARKPKRENLQFFGSAKDALFSGYRACKRCRPLSFGDVPAGIQSLLAEIEADPTLRIRDRELTHRGLQPVQVRRFFQKNYGLTFQAYQRALRLGQSLEQIRKGGNLYDVAFGHSYESNSGFRTAFEKHCGFTPAKGRDAKAITMGWMEGPLGPMIAGTSEMGLCFLEFTDRRMIEAQVETLKRHFRRPLSPGSSQHLVQLQKEMNEYFAGKRKDFSVPLEFPGSLFQQKVWNSLLTIPYGETCAYQDIAKQVGSPGAVRAVGRANGQNRIAIVTPCHRVVNRNGELGGYGGGLWRKKYLLDLEREK